MSLYNPSRDQARQFLFEAWAKFKQHLPLTDLEKIAVEVIQMHPEYHVVLDSPERYMNQQYFPEMIALLKKGMTYIVSDDLSSHRSITQNGVKLMIIDGDFLNPKL